MVCYDGLPTVSIAGGNRRPLPGQTQGRGGSTILEYSEQSRASMWKHATHFL